MAKNRIAKIGEIWITLIPKLLYDSETETMNFMIEKRPCLIVDDGRGFLIEENSNYSGLKLTTRLNKIKQLKKRNKKLERIGT